MKKIVLALTLSLSLFSQSQFEKNFISQGGKITPEVNVIMEKDFHFHNAIINLEKELTKKTITYKDPENPNIEKKFEQVMPDYVKAYEEIKKSVSKFGNPLSAYMGLHLIKTVYSKSTQLKEFRDFSELLYNSQKDICTAYIDYGETLENGYFTKANKLLAKDVYKEGLERDNCKKGWHLNVLSSKYESLKRTK